MTTRTLMARTWMTMAAAVFLAFAPLAPAADSAADIERESRAAMEKLYRTVPAAKLLGEKAKAVLVFPDIVKGGLLIGGQYGKGALFEGDQVKAFYSTAAVSYGLQAGVQTFGYALLLMNEAALKYLDKSEGWELGVGPTLVVVDEGVANSLTTTTARDDVYAFIFGQEGLMLGLGIQGSKITRIHPGK
ncbi:MAG: lipid-binding SYLF domain-containing protein [Gammaproteobacteria bacterium]|jgi:lipid-binding SYLF domain-containing protein|nr:lipid-binding SYLF domain-containing protein [Gammaproteobacteria bacterium]